MTKIFEKYQHKKGQLPIHVCNFTKINFFAVLSQLFYRHFSENPCTRCLFLIKLQDVLKIDSCTRFFPVNFAKFLSASMFCRTFTKVCLWSSYVLGHLNITSSQRISFLNHLHKKVLKITSIFKVPAPATNFLSQNDANQTSFQ